MKEVENLEFVLMECGNAVRDDIRGYMIKESSEWTALIPSKFRNVVFAAIKHNGRL